MSGSQIGEKMRTKLRIPATRRQPLRTEVSALRVKVLRMPQTLRATVGGVEVTPLAVLNQLDAAKTWIWSQAVTDTARKSAVAETEAILVRERPKVVELGKVAAASPAAAALVIPVASKETAANAKTLTTEIDALRTDLTGKQKVIGSVSHAQGQGYNALLAEESELRQRAAGSIVDGAKLTAFRAEIAAIRGRMDTAVAAGEAWERRKVKVLERITAFEVELEPLRVALAKAGDPKLLGREFAELETLGRMASGSPAGVAAIEAQVLKLRAMVETAKARPTPEYAGELTAAATSQARVAKDQEEFRKAVGDKLHKLSELARALGGTVGALETEHRDTLATLGIPDAAGAFPNPQDLGTKFAAKVARETAAQGAKLATLKTQAGALVADAKAKVATQRTALGATPVLAVDWKQIDGMAAALDQQMAGTDVVNVGSVSALQSAKVLAQQLVVRLDALAVPQARTGIDAFQPAYEKFAADLKNNAIGGEKSPLGTYFPDQRSELDKSFTAFRKDMATLTADKAMATFTALDTLFRTKITEAAGIAAAATTASTVLDNRRKAYGKLRGKVFHNFEEPNEASMALAALKAAIELRPASKDAIDAAVAGIGTGFPATATAATLQQGVVAAKAATAAEDARKSQVQTDLKTRRREADAAFSDAKALVREVGGDQLALDAIGVLLEEADRHIKSGEKEAATRSMARMMQRIDMLLVNPEGEVNRQRKALPKLFGEWQAVLATTAGLLDTTKTTIGAYKLPDTDPQAAKVAAGVARLCGQMEEYSRRFTQAPVPSIEPLLSQLASDDVPETGRRKAREMALAIIAGQSAALQKHPLSRMLAECPFPGASAIPGRLQTGLSRLEYTVLTSVR